MTPRGHRRRPAPAHECCRCRWATAACRSRRTSPGAQARRTRALAAHQRRPRSRRQPSRRNAASLQAFFDELGDRRASIRAVSIDMSGGYERAIGEHTTAEVCFDPFHVVRVAADAVDQVRRDESNAHDGSHTKTGKWARNTCWALLKAPDRDPRSVTGRRAVAGSSWGARATRAPKLARWCFSKEIPDLLAGSRRCCWLPGALPQTPVWDRQSGLHARDGRRPRRSPRSAAQAKVDWHFCAPADPQTKGVVERLHARPRSTAEPADRMRDARSGLATCRVERFSWEELGPFGPSDVVVDARAGAGP
ncbi:MAG TPA: transposase [Solirubrobacteraceae bacterium]|nr:transposase [Solirubrobacteraceae bacterium]